MMSDFFDFYEGDGLETTIESFQGIFVQVDKQSLPTVSNEAFRKFNPSDQEDILRICQKVISTHQPVKFQKPYRNEFYEFSIQPVLDANGDSISAVATGFAISFTAFKEFVLQNISEVVFFIVIKGDDFYYGGVNEVFETFTGFKAENVIGKRVLDFVSLESHERILKHYREAIDNKKIVRWEEHSRFPTGVKYGEVNISPVFNDQGECLGLIGTVYDLSERKATELELAKNYSILEAIIEGTTDLVFVKDLEGRYIWVNTNGALLVGKKKEYCIEKTDYDFFDKEIADMFVKNDSNVIETGKARTFEEKVPVKGEDHYFLTVKGVYKDLSGKVLGTIGISRDVTELKETQKDLQNSYSTLKATLDATADGILVVDSSKHITLYNQRFLDIWNIPESFLLSHTYDENLQRVLNELENPERCLHRLEEIHKKPDLESYDLLNFKNGRRCERYSLPQFMRGEIVGRVFSYRDVTARVAVEEKLQESEKRKGAILDSSMETIITMDHLGIIIEVNPAVEKTFGYKPADIIGKELGPLIIPLDFREAHKKGLERYLKTGEQHVFGRRMEFTAQKSDGTLFPVEVSISVIEGKDHPIFTGFIRDISERVISDTKIRQYAQRARILADASSSFTSARLNMHKICESAVDWSSDAIQGGAIIEIINDQGKSEVAAYKHVSEELMVSLEILNSQKLLSLDPIGSKIVISSGNPLSRFLPFVTQELEDINFLILPVRVPGKTIGLLKVFREKNLPFHLEDEEFLLNLADRAALAINNARLFNHSNDALRLREDFLKIASHELRTPLTPLKVQLDLLVSFLKKEIISVGGKGKELIDMISVADIQVMRLSRLVDDMLDVTSMATRKVTLALESVDLAKIVRETTSDYMGTISPTNFIVDIDTPDKLNGDFDQRRIRHILENLLSNAVKFGENKPIKVSLTKHDHSARLEVKDFGMGIPEYDLPRIFGRFERGLSVNTFGGFGVGLFITKQIVEAHGGKIYARSDLGRGSTFTVDLPCS